MYLEFLRQNESLIKECYEQNQIADQNRSKLHSASIAIQSFWRGFVVRQHLKHLNRSAISIQSTYRGYKQRKRFHVLMFETVNRMRINFYDLMATKIQACFRGYMSRKTKHNFYARKKYLEMVKLQNEIVCEHLARFKKQRDEENFKLKSIEEEKIIINEARKTHYLLSTSQIQGVYDPRSKNGQKRYPMDEMLRNVQPLSKLDRKERKVLPNIGETTCTSASLDSEMMKMNTEMMNIEFSQGTAAEFNNYTRTTQLTNENRIRFQKCRQVRQPQGPFKKERIQILEQRFRPINPSLRVSESYNTGIEEARQQLKFDDYAKKIYKGKEFLPVMNSMTKEKYQQLLHTTSAYGHIDYGNKHFRAYESKNTDKKKSGQDSVRFATVVSPIPDFEKYMGDRERNNRNSSNTIVQT